MNTKETYDSGTFKGIVSKPLKPAKTLMIALHGVGSNERDLIEVAKEISPDSIIVSLRSPIVLASDSYSFFHVQFTPNGPVHNWDEAKKNFELLEKEILLISKKYNIPISQISVMGFSQGSIMTMGLLLQSSLNLSHYLCFSGRTLPEFAESGLKNPSLGKGRKVFLAHGIQDGTLPLKFSRDSKAILEKINANLTYREFDGGHGLNEQIIAEAKKWISN